LLIDENVAGGAGTKAAAVRIDAWYRIVYSRFHNGTAESDLYWMLLSTMFDKEYFDHYKTHQVLKKRFATIATYLY